MRTETMAFKQNKRVKNVRNKYLKPGELAKLRYSRTATRSCKDIGKKRIIVLHSEKEDADILDKPAVAKFSINPAASSTPSRTESTEFQLTTGIGDISKQQKLIGMPKTPQAVHRESQSRLESLPLDVLVKILCHLHHDQLRTSFHVSQRVRTAVLLARQLHFNYTTPDRSRVEVLRTKTPLPTEHWPFVRYADESKGDGRGNWISRPHTPKAPRHGPRPSRLHSIDMKQIAAVLFREPTYPSKCSVPPGLPRPVLKPLASNRVLFCEDELCQAVAQNKLR